MQAVAIIIVVAIAGLVLWFTTKKPIVPPPVPPEPPVPPAPPVVPVVCPYCGATFSTQAELNAHIAAEHPSKPPIYTCPYCRDTFTTELALAAHIAAVHPTPEPPPPQPPVPPPPEGAAVFAYASDIRSQSATKGLWSGIKFEVDIKNIGTASGSCHPVAYIESTAGGTGGDMGTQTIAPGKTATFAGEWYWTSGPLQEGDWWAPRNIVSEAGVITFAFGRSLQLLEVTTERAEDGRYWVSQRIRVPQSCFVPTITVGNIVVSQAEMYPPGYLYPQIVISQSGEYTVKGVYFAYIGEPRFRSNPVALPKGTYDMLSTLRYAYLRGPDEVQGWYIGWRNIKVGQVVVE